MNDNRLWGILGKDNYSLATRRDIGVFFFSEIKKKISWMFQ